MKFYYKQAPKIAWQILTDEMNLLLSEVQIHLSAIFYLTILSEDKEGREGSLPSLQY